MKEAINDYNHEYGTSFSLDEINAYNKNINDRLARKGDQYKPQSERLDMVIVVYRLLTGFDSQYLSTLYVDRPPMNPQDIIQAFSRTNRIFDEDKRYGNIVTFQYPRTFSQKIDDALKLYSQGGIGDVIAPTWEKSKAKFDKSVANIQEFHFDDPEILSEATEEEQKAFVKQYQEFDKNFAAVQTYDEFNAVDPEQDYSLTPDVLDKMQGAYETLVEKFKKQKTDDQEDDEPIDTDYELESVIDKSVNYQYILGLMQSYIPDEGELIAQEDVNNSQEIEEYIKDLGNTNKPLAQIVQQLWEKIKQDPQQYAGKQVDQLMNEMVDQAYNQELVAFAAKYNVSLDDLKFVIKNYDPHAEKQAGVNQLLTRDAFKEFKANNADSELKRMMDWKKQVRSQLSNLYVNKISPLIND